MATTEEIFRYLDELLRAGRAEMEKSKIPPLEVLFVHNDRTETMPVEQIATERDLIALRYAIMSIIGKTNPKAVLLVAHTAYGRRKVTMNTFAKAKKGEGCIVAAGSSRETGPWVSYVTYSKKAGSFSFQPPTPPQQIPVNILDKIWHAETPKNFRIDNVLSPA